MYYCQRAMPGLKHDMHAAGAAAVAVRMGQQVERGAREQELEPRGGPAGKTAPPERANEGWSQQEVN